MKQSKIGEVYIFPFDVYLKESPGIVVQPDLFITLKGNTHIIRNDGVHGTLDLIVEIMSPGGESRNRVTKRELYEAMGVKEYFMVDPENSSVTRLVLNIDCYYETSFINEHFRFQSVLLNMDFEFPLKKAQHIYKASPSGGAFSFVNMCY